MDDAASCAETICCGSRWGGDYEAVCDGGGEETGGVAGGGVVEGDVEVG